ncbi:MAG: response regulator [Burkholderiales bacterium]|nr:response regulator [Burkholderiales bacterium]
MALFKQANLNQIGARQAPATDRLIIMLVDDEEANRRVLSSLLAPRYQVLQAADGLEAWKMINAMPNPERLACIVSDQRMPGMTGVELLQKTCADYPNTVRIIVTGYSDIDAIIDSINKADIFRFIIKPLDSNDFLMTIKRAVESFEMNARIAAHQRDLETRIQERTAELQLANDSLKQHQTELLEARRVAESASHQKSEFLAVMSHELRTPLSGIIGMLKLGLRGEMGDESRQRFELSLSNAQALLTLITDILDFSKIEAGKLDLEQIDFPLADTINTALAIFEERAVSKGIDFVLDIDPSLPAFVRGDPTRLRQVLLNLVSNAIKFTENGWVKVEVTRLPGKLANGLCRIGFAVHDSGIGIPASALPRLFQKFEQVDASTTRRYGGTGLGLAISRQLVELMGGQLEVTSTPDVGSCFCFELEMAPGEALAPAQHPADEPHSHQLHILCAEDFPTNQMIIRALLEDRGHRVEIVENGWLAVQALARENFDMILMDGRMPEMDGVTATLLIRQGGNEECKVQATDIHITALTANVSPTDLQAYLAAGMDDFLTKPLDERQLHRRLSEVIEKRLRLGIALPPLLRPSHSDLNGLFDITDEDDAPSPPSEQVQTADAVEPDLLTRMRVRFAQDWPIRLAQLRQAQQDGDRESAGRIFHGLKGSLGYLQTPPSLQQRCGEMEHKADQGAWDVIRDVLPQLQQEIETILREPGWN